MWCDTVGCASRQARSGRTCRPRRRSSRSRFTSRTRAGSPSALNSSAVASASSSESVEAASGAQQRNVSTNVNISKNVDVPRCAGAHQIETSSHHADDHAARRAQDERQVETDRRGDMLKRKKAIAAAAVAVLSPRAWRPPGSRSSSRTPWDRRRLLHAAPALGGGHRAGDGQPGEAVPDDRNPGRARRVQGQERPRFSS